MRKVLNCLGAFALVWTLAACGSTEEPANEEVANDMNAAMADPDNPFGQSETTMDQAMTAAVGVNAADSWVRKMIEHHRSAVAMSRIVLTRNPTADVAKMAQMTIDDQGKEITDLEKLVATGTPNPASAELYRPAAMQMHSAMMAAKGADVSETYLRKMLAHHKGAVVMSNIALASGATGAVRAQVEKTKATQQMEVDMVEAMLSGEPMMEMSAKPVGAEAAGSAPIKLASAAKPTPTAPKALKPAPDPHAGMNMNNM